jgi:hypothetical protein
MHYYIKLLDTAYLIARFLLLMRGSAFATDAIAFLFGVSACGNVTC